MKRATRRTKRTLDILHYLTSVGWVGVALCQLTLNLVALLATEQSMRFAVHEITRVFDRALLIPLGSGSLITGVLLGLKTKWGLVQHWWVFAKLVLTIAVLIFGGVWMGAWVEDAIIASGGGPESVSAKYLSVRGQLLTGSVTSVTTLVVITVISVVKPWGQTFFARGGRRPVTRREAQRAT